MKVLVTGGAGFIGSHLCEALLAQGDTVISLDDLSTGNSKNLETAKQNTEFSSVIGSILEDSLVNQLVESVDGVKGIEENRIIDSLAILQETLDSLEH